MSVSINLTSIISASFMNVFSFLACRAPGIGVHTFHGASKKERERLLERVQRRGGVLMVSYGLVMTCWEQINHYRGNDFVWVS